MRTKQISPEELETKLEEERIRKAA